MSKVPRQHLLQYMGQDNAPSGLVLGRALRHKAEVQVLSPDSVSGAPLGRTVVMCNGENRTGSGFPAALKFSHLLQIQCISLAGGCTLSAGGAEK